MSPLPISGENPNISAPQWLDPHSASLRIGETSIRIHSNRSTAQGEGVPTVVFENGLGSEIASWGSLLDRTAEFAPVFAYDRPGIGGSPPSNYRPTPLNVASQLRRLLSEAGIKPPFVLVGFSLGGVYVRTYAALHQDDLAGLVYIEPLDFTETRDETLATFVEAGLGEAEMREYDEALDHFGRENRSPPVIAEWEELRTLVLDSFAQYSQVAPAPQVPQVLVASAKADTPFARMSFEFDVWEKISSRHRLA